MLIHDILTPTELNDIINNPVVQTHKAQLSNTNVVKFSVSLSTDIRVKLSDRLGIELSSFPRAVPMSYKSHSLSTGSGGSGVRNSRYKKRRT